MGIPLHHSVKGCDLLSKPLPTCKSARRCIALEIIFVLLAVLVLVVLVMVMLSLLLRLLLLLLLQLLLGLL